MVPSLSSRDNAIEYPLVSLSFDRAVFKIDSCHGRIDVDYVGDDHMATERCMVLGGEFELTASSEPAMDLSGVRKLASSPLVAI